MKSLRLPLLASRSPDPCPSSSLLKAEGRLLLLLSSRGDESLQLQTGQWRCSAIVSCAEAECETEGWSCAGSTASLSGSSDCPGLAAVPCLAGYRPFLA